MSRWSSSGVMNTHVSSGMLKNEGLKAMFFHVFLPFNSINQSMNQSSYLRSFTELNKEIRTRSELIGTNNDHGLPRKYTFGNQRNNNSCDDATIIIAMTQQQLLRQYVNSINKDQRTK